MDIYFWLVSQQSNHILEPQATFEKKVKLCIAVCANASALRELTYHMGSHSVTCHPAEVTFPPLPQPKLVLDLTTPEGRKAELTWLVG